MWIGGRRKAPVVCPPAPEKPDLRVAKNCNWIAILDKDNCIIEYECEPSKTRLSFPSSEVRLGPITDRPHTKIDDAMTSLWHSPNGETFQKRVSKPETGATQRLCLKPVRQLHVPYPGPFRWGDSGSPGLVMALQRPRSSARAPRWPPTTTTAASGSP